MLLQPNGFVEIDHRRMTLDDLKYLPERKAELSMDKFPMQIKSTEDDRREKLSEKLRSRFSNPR